MRYFFLFSLVCMQLAAGSYPLKSAFCSTQVNHWEFGGRLTADMELEIDYDGEQIVAQAYLKNGTIYFSDDVKFEMIPPTMQDNAWDIPNECVALTLTIQEDKTEASGEFALGEISTYSAGKGSSSQHTRMEPLAKELIQAAVASVEKVIPLIGYHSGMESEAPCEEVEDTWCISSYLHSREKPQLCQWALKHYLDQLRIYDRNEVPLKVWCREEEPVWVETVTYQYSQQADLKLPRELTLLLTGDYPTTALWVDLIGFEVYTNGDEQ